MESIYLDAQEEKSLDKLKNEYEKFIKPSLIAKSTTTVKNTVYKVAPDFLKEITKDGLDSITESKIWIQVMKIASEGFMILQGVTSKYLINEKEIIRKLQTVNPNIKSLDQIKNMKGYEIEKIVNSLDIKTYLSTIAQSAPTGAVGIAGLPINIVLSIFIQYRTVQLIAMYFGFDIKNSPTEMEYAGAVLMEIISKGTVSDTGGLNELIGKMMVEAELSSLKVALKKSGVTYSQMVAQKGLQQIYVKIRAITNKAALEALNKTNTKGIENAMIKKILEALSAKMSSKAGAKAVPGISAVFSVLIDVYQINKVLKMANVIYHKRFLVEKAMCCYNLNEEVSFDIYEDRGKADKEN